MFKRMTLFTLGLFASSAIIAQISQSNFVFTVNTSNTGFSNNNQYKLHLDNSYSNSCDIDWDNDGVFDTLGVSTSLVHTYSTGGIKTIRIRGAFPSLKLGDRKARIQSAINDNDKDKLISIDQWGDQVWQDLDYAFSNCVNLQTVPTDTIDLSAVNSLEGMFYKATSFDGPVNHWNISTINNLSYMFAEALAFNQPLNHWDVSSVIEMGSLFNAGNIGQITSSFNYPLNDWDVSSVRFMNNMFHSAVSFNQPLNNWDVSSVENMDWMFVNAFSFNQPLDNWDVSAVKSMMWTFGYALNFNQNINNWVVDSVTSMNNMFTGADRFNQPLDNWNVSNVTGMAYMFQFADEFDQSLTTWDFSNVNIMIGFLSSSGYSTANYDSLLMHWNSNYTSLGLSVGVDQLEYCQAKSQRDTLIAFGWTFNGDSQASNCQLVGLSELELDTSELTTFPNPANETLNISLSKMEDRRLRIYNVQGRLVKEQMVFNANTVIDISNFSNGVYFLQMGNQNKRFVVKH